MIDLILVLASLAFFGSIIFAFFGLFKKSKRSRYLKIGGLGLLTSFITMLVAASFLEVPSPENQTDSWTPKTSSTKDLEREREALKSQKDEEENRLTRQAEREAEKLEKEKNKHCNDKASSRIMAYTMAETFVDRRLVSPATSKYPSFSMDKVRYQGDCEYLIHSYVDSQNGFGAMLRSTFSIVVKNNYKNETWSVIELNIE